MSGWMDKHLWMCHELIHMPGFLNAVGAKKRLHVTPGASSETLRQDLAATYGIWAFRLDDL